MVWRVAMARVGREPEYCGAEVAVVNY